MIGQSSNHIEVAVANGTAYIKIFGRATFQVVASFRDFVQKNLDDNHGVFIDLAECETLDSTFIGTLAALTMKSKVDGLCRVKIFNVSRHVMGIFTTLGLLSILDVEKGDAGGDEEDFKPLEKSVRDKVEITNLMLDAHLTLSEINERNAVEFKDVVEYLKSQSE